MTDRLDEIRKRLEAATPGPWFTCLGSGQHQCTAIGTDDDDGVFSLIADCLPDYSLKEKIAVLDHLPNMNLIAAAPDDYHYMLGVIAELQVELEAKLMESNTFREAVKRTAQAIEREKELHKQIEQLQTSNALKDKALELVVIEKIRCGWEVTVPEETTQYWLDKAKEMKV